MGWRSRRSTAVSALAGGAAAGAGLLVAQVLWAGHRPLPTGRNQDASGLVGDSGPVVVLGVAGDSCSTGPGLACVDDIWVRVAAGEVARRLGCRIDVRSVAEGGARCADVARSQLTRLAAHDPDVVAVVVGGNDAIRATRSRQLVSDLEVMASGLDDLGVPVLVGGLGWLGSLPRVPAPLSWALGTRSRTVNRALAAAVARCQRLVFVDVAAGDPAFASGGRDLFVDDLFHASAAGHRVWADLAVPALEAAVIEVLERRGEWPATAGADAEVRASTHTLSTGPRGRLSPG